MPHDDPRARLAPHFRKPRWSPPAGAARPLPPREVLTVKRLDVTVPTARPRHVAVSLWRIRTGEARS